MPFGVISLLGTYPKGKKWEHMFMQNRVNKCPNSIIYNRQMVETVQMPTY